MTARNYFDDPVVAAIIEELRGELDELEEAIVAGSYPRTMLHIGIIQGLGSRIFRRNEEIERESLNVL